MPNNGKLRLFHLPFSFMLPQRVASERGYFADEGLDVEVVERDRESVDWKYIPAEETLTGDHGIDLYPVCKWESIKRTWDMGDGRVVAAGTFADQPYTVYVRPESDVEGPADLAGVPVGVNRRTGQEYTVIRALEEHVPPEAVALEHHGMPTDRLRALRDGEVEAVSLLEPQSTLAEHLGFRAVLRFENHVGIVAADGLDGEALDAFMRAYERAVREINADPDAFREEYLAMLDADADVAPDLFEGVDRRALLASIEVPTYEPPEPADRAELGAHLEWMKRRQLLDGSADVDAIVGPAR
ncbi:ABC transporter substrate-binding protein [Halomarina halobia]|uniref:ABC transporter substrate-binding protein n=1 Tax=Halomarina halobia TaxID=3033386 RepID=A0ABD6A9C5_9EURY|nr:ABC transporter substrate-binding protein [Halomarina sp. PSR21]